MPEFDPAEAIDLAEAAAEAVADFTTYLWKFMETESPMVKEAGKAQAIMSFVRNSLYIDPYCAYSGVKSPKGSVPCRQCTQRADENGWDLTIAEATLLAPQVLDHKADTYEYVAICDDCHTDWWGPGGNAKPAGAPPFAPIPSWG